MRRLSKGVAFTRPWPSTCRPRPPPSWRPNCRARRGNRSTAASQAKQRIQPPESGGDSRRRREWGCGSVAWGPKFAQRTLGASSRRRAMKVAAEPADKPGSVVDSHSSRRIVTDTLKQPTRRHRGPRHCLPIWSCSRWGLPCRPVARLAVRSYRTISPLPARLLRHRRYLSVALSVGSRRPGVTWHRALWSPDFPRHRLLDDATAWPTPPPALSHV